MNKMTKNMANDEMATCQQIKQSLSQLRMESSPLSDLLDQIVLHLANCPHCLANERIMAELSNQAKAIPELEAPDYLVGAIFQALEASKIESPEANKQPSAKSEDTLSSPTHTHSIVFSVSPWLLFSIMACLAVTMLATNSFDSTDGWLAWLACAAVLFVQQLFFGRPRQFKFVVR